MNIYQELKWRNLIFQESNNLECFLNKHKINIYGGFDPTSSSLHIGNLMPLISLKRFKDYGHGIIALAGGGTGLIGDPSGKQKERLLLDKEQIEFNISQIKKQLQSIIGENDDFCMLKNNIDWLKEINFIDFLRDIGKHFPIGQLLQKECIDTRLKDSGISYTEFSYILLQSYDFYHLNSKYKCNVQIGGSDQWGNMTMGIDLIRRLNKNEAHCLTLPLITTSSGQKFGKSEKGAIWLDKKRTSVYEFFQYWLNTSDDDVIQFLKYFTFLTKEEILSYEIELKENAYLRKAQHKLAQEMTLMIHGKDELDKVVEASDILFGKKEFFELDREILAGLHKATTGASYESIKKSRGLLQVLVDCKLTNSIRNARELVKNNAVSINNRKVSDIEYQLKETDLIHKEFTVIKKGKKDFSVVKISDE